MHIKPRAIATVLCMIFFIGFAVCGVVRSTDKETSEIKQSYPVLTVSTIRLSQILCTMSFTNLINSV